MSGWSRGIEGFARKFSPRLTTSVLVDFGGVDERHGAERSGGEVSIHNRETGKNEEISVSERRTEETHRKM